MEMLATIRDSGVTILMVEQNFKASIKIGDRFLIMSKGQIVFEGDPEALLAAEETRKNYLEV
jgi:branched-chain amino acid transport system ATP-binding protein